MKTDLPIGHPKQSVRWLRYWHKMVVSECGTDDITVLIAAVRCLNAFRKMKAFGAEMTKLLRGL